MTTTPRDLLRRWVLAQAGQAGDWFAGALETMKTERDLHIVMGYAPRRLGKDDLVLDADDLAAAEAARPGWNPANWSVDGAARVCALLTLTPPRPFAEIFKDLRRTSDVAEMIALYRGLPLYPDPDALDFECGEGLRSNLKPVFEAIAHNNPFPRDHFDDHRWNHMVLKALFVDSTLAPITGLDDRANPELARILIDYAHERWAAGRPVTPELWRPVAPFQNDPVIAQMLDKARAEGREIAL